MELVPESISFPGTEEETLKLWEAIDAFHTQERRHRGMKEFSFYDGPPFATGTPHYGHILAGTIKDTVTRYAHMDGHHVTRRFGWDTHGLPIEFEIDKLLNVKTRDQVLEMGIKKYNEACRGIVMRFAAEWEKTVTRLGRWIDFKNDYKTLDLSYMESVWWVFRQLWDKDLVYKGFKVMPYSLACSTPLSNFEAGLNYKERSDPYILVSFPLVDDPKVEFVVMTTTPWTLPSNLALCVNGDYDYVKIRDKESDRHYILLKECLHELYKNPVEGEQYEVLKSYKGKELEGWKYVPMFDYFKSFEEDGAFRVLCDSYVKQDSGTGVVHQAPAFGLDDSRVCMQHGIIKKGGKVPLPLGPNGHFTSEVPDWEGELVFDANKGIMQDIKKRGRMIKQLQKFHNYPYCWRSDTPLIYRGVLCWFIRVEQIKEQILACQGETYWVPKTIANRFVRWLENAQDWAVSRNRFWGTPLPLWANDDFSEVQCIGSVEELEKLSGVRVTDLHRENVDEITIPAPSGRGVLRRIPEVFDCWFESGSMPYAQVHYPFENQELFENSFPADFIAEGMDQTRGWFYTLMVLSTALRGKPAFKNLIANGMVLAADGKKMSKRLKNYPDPVAVINSHGSDALRLYLINSPVVRAEDLRFREEGVNDVLKDVLLPWFHAYRFCVESLLLLSEPFRPNVDLCFKSKNVMDRWILASLQTLVKFVRKEMADYRLYTVIPELVKYIEQLTNWYLRSNRSRMQQAGKSNGGGEEEGSSDDDRLTALNVMYEVLLTMSVLMAPFTPFLAEYFYQNLRHVLPPEEDENSRTNYHIRVDSVHYLPLPSPREEMICPDVLRSVFLLQQSVELARSMRERHNLPLKQPLQKLVVYLQSQSDLEKLTLVQEYLKDQVKVKVVELSLDVSAVKAVLVPNQKKLGGRLRKDKNKVIAAMGKLNDKEVRSFMETKEIEIEGYTITMEDVTMKYVFEGGSSTLIASENKGMVVVLDTALSPELKKEFFVNQTVNFLQRLRKNSGVHKGDPIELYYQPTNPKLEPFFLEVQGVVEAATKRPFLHLRNKPSWLPQLGSSSGVIDGVKVNFVVAPVCWCTAVKGVDEKTQWSLDMTVGMRKRENLQQEVEKNQSSLSLKVDGQEHLVKLGESLFSSAADRAVATQNKFMVE